MFGRIHLDSFVVRFGYLLSLLTRYGSVQIFFFHDTVLVGCVFVGIYPFVPGLWFVGKQLIVHSFSSNPFYFCVINCNISHFWFWVYSFFPANCQFCWSFKNTNSLVLQFFLCFYFLNCVYLNLIFIISFHLLAFSLLCSFLVPWRIKLHCWYKIFLF